MKQINRQLFFLILLAFLSACSGLDAEPEAQVPAIEFEDCDLEAPLTDTRIKAQCGTHAVYENPDAQAGVQFDIKVAVIPALSSDPAPDPLFFITGGPGQGCDGVLPGDVRRVQ